MSESSLLIVTGHIGAGKTSLSKRLVREHGYERRCVGDELALLYLENYGMEASTPVSGLARMAVHKAIRKSEPDYFARFITENLGDRTLIDGLRNYKDACYAVERGARVVSLIAPPELCFERVVGRDPVKDASIEAVWERSKLELDDPDPDGGQTLLVMGLAKTHGFEVDATQGEEAVYQEVVCQLSL